MDLSVSINDLLYQLALGHSPLLNPPLWYQADLIIITVLFYLIFKLLPKDKGFACIWIITAISLIFQYSGINENIFGRFKNEISYTIGSVAEMIPFATIGYSLAITNHIEELKRNRLGSSITIIFVCIFLIKYDIAADTLPGFGYCGIRNIVIGTLIFLLAVIVPFERLPETLKKAVRILSKFTFGIFCIHFGIGRCTNFLMLKLGLSVNTFMECILIFISSYIVCGLIWLIPCKYTKQLVE